MSADAGRTWRRSFPGAAIFGFGASGDGRLIVLSDAGLVTLDANGSALGRSTPPADALCAIETGNQLFVGTIGRGVVCQAPDQGEWNPSSVGLEATPRDHVRAIGHAQLVTTSPSGAILHSPDGGRSWRDLSAAPLEAVLDFDARVDAEHGLEIIACDGQRAAIHRDTWQELDAEAPLAVAWLDRAPALITADGAFVCDQFQTNMLPGRPRLIGARLIPVPGHSALLWTVLHLEDAGVLVLRSSDGGTQWELLLQTNTTNAVAIAVCVEASGREEALLAVGNGIYRLLESPAPVWTGDDAMAIAAIVIDPDGGILLATNQGLIALSPDLAWSEPVTGSPVPLLDVDIEPTGGVIVVERGGSVWRYDFPP